MFRSAPAPFPHASLSLTHFGTLDSQTIGHGLPTSVTMLGLSAVRCDDMCIVMRLPLLDVESKRAISCHVILR